MALAVCASSGLRVERFARRYTHTLYAHTCALHISTPTIEHTSVHSYIYVQVGKDTNGSGGAQQASKEQA